VKQAAAKKYCLKTSVLNLEVKDVVLIVECGGASVDRQAYELTSASPCSFPKLILSSGRHLQVRSSPPPLCFSLGWANRHYSEARRVAIFRQCCSYATSQDGIYLPAQRAARRAHTM
jgi:hypothetical protein